MKIFITGANGFIGSNLVRYYAKKGYEVIGLSRKSSDNWRLKELPENIEIVFGDVTNIDSVNTILKEYQPDGIINTVVYGGYPFQTDEDLIFRVNCVGTRILLNSAISHGFDWFINTGSSSEYGNKSIPMAEDMLADPLDSYGISKLFSSLYCKSKANEFDLPIFTIRPFSVYGPYENSNRLIPHILISILNNETATLSNPNTVRDFIYIEDVYKAYHLIEKNFQRLKNGEIFNVGGGRSTSILEVVKAISKALDREIKVNWDQAPSRKSDSIKLWEANTNKLKNSTGWIPEYDLVSGLRKTYGWFSDYFERNGKE